MNKLAIAYRIYPKVSKVPYCFKDSKYKLSDVCLSSMKLALTGVNYKIYAILDGCPDEYRALFRTHFSDSQLEFISVDSVGNRNTFKIQLEILAKQTFAEFVFLAEDDYFYLSKAFVYMIDFMEHSDADFVSPYDHSDYYTLGLHDYGSRVKISSERHWRTVSATCLTFLTRKSVLRDTLRTLETYTKGNHDAAMWLALTKMNLPWPTSFINPKYCNRLHLSLMRKIWRFSSFQVLFGHKYKLYSPLPSLATHLDRPFVSPVHKWNEIIRKHVEKFHLDYLDEKESPFS